MGGGGILLFLASTSMAAAKAAAAASRSATASAEWRGLLRLTRKRKSRLRSIGLQLALLKALTPNGPTRWDSLWGQEGATENGRSTRLTKDSFMELGQVLD